MNPMYFVLLYPYFLIGFFSFLALTGRWSNPWPWDKALTFGLFWLPCVIFVFFRALVTGAVKLVKEEL